MTKDPYEHDPSYGVKHPRCGTHDWWEMEFISEDEEKFHALIEANQSCGVVIGVGYGEPGDPLSNKYCSISLTPEQARKLAIRLLLVASRTK
jgi:hypothetical protein